MIKKKEQHENRKRRVRAKLSGTKGRPRLCVFRSNKYISAQLIDDTKGKTLLGLSDKIFIADKKNNLQKKPVQGLAWRSLKN